MQYFFQTTHGKTTGRMSFQERAERGDPFGAFQYAAVAGSLWAIGSSWSTAIRQIVRTLLPEDTMDIVIAEVVSALATTGLGISIAICVTRQCRRKTSHVAPPALSVDQTKNGNVHRNAANRRPV